MSQQVATQTMGIDMKFGSWHSQNIDTDACFLPIPDRSSFHTKSHPIRIKGIHRTPSELQLCEDEAIADYRDYCMYSRIVDGIHRRQATDRLDVRFVNDTCIASITRARCQPVIEERSSSPEEGNLSPTSNAPRSWAYEGHAMTVSHHVTPSLHDNATDGDEDEEIFLIDL